MTSECNRHILEGLLADSLGEMVLKQLPIGIQSISEIIRGGYVYIDKTRFVQNLMKQGKFYFMARPRRFGKTLFISTLEAILNGNKELFEDCAIFTSNYEWKKHPVLRFDFTQISVSTPEEFRLGLQEILDAFAETYKLTLKGSSLQAQFSNLVKSLSLKYAQVVVLVDEYDKPIVDNLTNHKVTKENRNILRTFFESLKGVDDHLKLVFVTGVAKFAQTSLHSGFNNLMDITTDAEYSDMLGYTQEEIETYLSAHIQKVVKNKGNTIDVFATMREWYNGYVFAPDGTPVYNPHSTLCFLKGGIAKSFWYRTGTPSFFIDQIKNLPEPNFALGPIEISADDLLDIDEPDSIHPIALMWQTGYLTILDYDEDEELYTLDFPNREVRRAFYKSLLKKFAKANLTEVTSHGKACRKQLETLRIDEFLKRLKSLFATIPFNLYEKNNEGHYHALFASFLEGMGIKVRPEEKTNNGQIDLVIDLPNIIYIVEFKLDQKAATALKQIQMKGYQEKYLHHNKKLALLGISFSSKSRNISGWKGEVFSPSGENIAFTQRLTKTQN